MALPKVVATATVYGIVPLFSITLLLLYGSSSGVDSWLLSKDTYEIPIRDIPIATFIPGNGRLGFNRYCPNTGPNLFFNHYRETGELLSSVPGGPCYQMNWDCTVTFCVFNDTAAEEGLQSGQCGTYDIFKPKPIGNSSEFDTAYQIISRFPGAGSCAAFNSVRFFHWTSFSCVVLICFLSLQMFILYPLGVKDYLSAIAKAISVMCFICTICAVISVSVFAGSIAGPSQRLPTAGGYKDAGFWLELSALIITVIFLALPNLVSVSELPETRIRVVSTDYDGPGNRTTINPQDPVMGVGKEADEESPTLDAESLTKKVKNLEATIASKDRQILDLKEEKARAGEGSAAADAEAMAAKDSEIAALKDSLATKEAEAAQLPALKEKVAALEAELAAKETELAALQASASAPPPQLSQPLFASPPEGGAADGAAQPTV